MKMFLSSLLRSRPAPPAGSPIAGTPLKPPPGFSRAEAQAWQALSGKAAALHESLRVASAMQLAPGLINRPNQNLLPPSKAFGTALRPLPAHRMPDTGNLLMLAPTRSEAQSWAAACLEQHVARVVDLRPAGSAGEPSCMDGGKTHQDHRGGLAARFRAINLRGFRSRKPAAAAEKTFGAHASKTLIGVTLSRGGRTLGASGQPSEGAEQLVEWLRVPIKRGEALSPALLKRLCGHLTTHKLESGQRQAIQTAADDRRAGATLEAALMLYAAHRAGQLLERTPEEAVQATCALISLQSGPTQLGTEDLMTLLAFVQDIKDVPLNPEGVRTALRPRGIEPQAPTSEALPPPPDWL